MSLAKRSLKEYAENDHLKYEKETGCIFLLKKKNGMPKVEVQYPGKLIPCKNPLRYFVRGFLSWGCFDLNIAV